MDLVSQLKRHKPVAIKAVMRDGTDRPVAVPKSGNRWQRCERTLDSLDWESLECLDKDGRVVGVVERPEDEYPEDEGDDGGSVTLHKLAKVMLEVMRTTAKETRQMFEAQMNGNAALVQAMIEGMRAVSDSYAMAMNVRAANTAAEGDPEMANMMKMALMLATQRPQQLPNPPQQAPKQPPRQTTIPQTEGKQ